MGVFVGGTRENGVSVRIGVNVGRGVSLGVTASVEVGVQVAASCCSVGVKVIVGLLKRPAPGGMKLRSVCGLTKTKTK